MYLYQSELFKVDLLTFKLYVCETELFEIELFLHLTVCKQKTYLNKWQTVCKQETVQLC